MLKDVSVRLRWASGCLLVAALAYGCSPEPDCHEIRTCGTAVVPDESSGGAGGYPQALDAGTGGGSAGDGIGGESAGTDDAVLGSECSDDAALACPEPASETVLVCKEGVWALADTCEKGSLCDSSDPGCAPVIPECALLAPGDSFCKEMTRHICGVDLVSVEREECRGRCVNGECVDADCGDGVLEDGEECDDGNVDDTDACTTACRDAACGDGFLFARDEECDDGNSSDSDGCTSACEKARCGDGFVNKDAEECDDGNSVNTDGCLDTCEAARCGDDFVQQGIEDCEDGNDDDGDDCPTNCQNAKCGDGFVRREHELCDDENTDAGDGCSPQCTPEPTQIAVGGSHVCAVFSDGRLKCWGRNNEHQVNESSDSGVGDRTSEIGANLQTVLTDVSSVAAGAMHTCAIQGQEVKCWGDNRNGQGKPGAPDELIGPLTVNPGNAKPISVCAGDTWSAALLQDGTVTVWGTFLPGVKEGLLTLDFSPGVAAIECSNNWICARIGTSAVPECAGPWFDRSAGVHAVDAYGVVDPVQGVSKDAAPIIDISAGKSHGCAVTASGDVRCWGYGETGAMMIDPSIAFWLFPEGGAASPAARVGSGRATSVAGGGDVTCVVFEGGSLKCWGTDYLGVLGQPERTKGGNNLGDEEAELGDGIEPIDLGQGIAVKSVATSGAHACALLTNGRIKCWGNNDQGQLATGDPEQVVGDDAGEMGTALRYASID